MPCLRMMTMDCFGDVLWCVKRVPEMCGAVKRNALFVDIQLSSRAVASVDCSLNSRLGVSRTGHP